MNAAHADSLRLFPTFTDARKRLRAVLDAAQAGLVTIVDRDEERFVVLSADHLREDLIRLCPAHAKVVAEGGGWAAMVPGLPLHGDGATFDEALEDLIGAFREYAEDWNDRLYRAPNHRANRVVVELIEISTDEQLKDWLVNDADARPDSGRLS